jgi:uncharacterized zinc-type alcohol dehydrogenase-like protein
MTMKTPAWGTPRPTTPLAALSIDRREPGPRDVEIDILFCGVCHSDVHTARGEWPDGKFPCVPGHEIVGRVTRVGGDVKSFRAGSLAAVGCMVDSCQDCASCRAGLEQFCTNQITFTYNSDDLRSPGQPTYGGYSKRIVVDERFVLRIAEGADLAAVAPLLCAGITTYSPLKHWKAGPGKRVGIVGLGGLGHMGVKLSHALGAHTTLFTTSPGKVADAKRLGADEVVISKDANAMAKHAGSFDFILDTVAAAHDLDAYTELLARDGTLCLVGAPAHPHPSPKVFNLIFKRRSIAGSLIGGIKETQEMLDFCAARKIVADVERIAIQEIEGAWARMIASDVKYRFVIDMASLK